MNQYLLALCYTGVTRSCLAGELRLDTLQVVLCAVVTHLYLDRSLKAHSHGAGHLLKGGQQLLRLRRTAPGVEDGPDM